MRIDINKEASEEIIEKIKEQKKININEYCFVLTVSNKLSYVYDLLNLDKLEDKETSYYMYPDEIKEVITEVNIEENSYSDEIDTIICVKYGELEIFIGIDCISNVLFMFFKEEKKIISLDDIKCLDDIK